MIQRKEMGRAINRSKALLCHKVTELRAGKMLPRVAERSL